MWAELPSAWFTAGLPEGSLFRPLPRSPARACLSQVGGGPSRPGQSAPRPWSVTTSVSVHQGTALLLVASVRWATAPGPQTSHSAGDPSAFPVRTLSRGWCPRHCLSAACAFFSRMQSRQLVPQPGNLEAGFRALQPPQLCVCRDPQGPAGPPEARGGGWRWEGIPRRGPGQSRVLSAALDLALPPVPPRAVRQESQPRPAGSVSPARTLEGKAAFPGSSLPGAEATDQEPSFFFSNGSLAFESVSVCEGRGGGHSAEKGVSGSNSHLM